MADKTTIEAAQQAYLKIDNEEQRHIFIAWCREQNNRAFFQETVRATQEGIDAAKEAAGVAADTVINTGKQLHDGAASFGKDIFDGAKQISQSFDEKMSSRLSKKEREG